MRNALFLALFAALGVGTPATAATLDHLRWDFRVIVVFTPTDTRGQEIRDNLAAEEGMRIRDIAWFVVTPERTHSNLDIRERQPLLDLHEAMGFEAVLIGKDGSVKARQSESLDVSALFERIDQMPMRRNEMRERQ
ncbi:DUF4174 domain-containing protein [Salinisphaera orenii]|uniref:DUF4174 domain-containing protein n=1 Tax=Salinisphaera orenii YIM 95161 TaxID=1051139 RepID=A0A423PPF6_9GAMM|nr:DUF4174 domain-containing protein [Salinisphaera halophila]ROO27467.1 hypothetical protein SAHL_11400 [Salinisphaera halophila YIM 95161]